MLGIGRTFSIIPFDNQLVFWLFVVGLFMFLFRIDLDVCRECLASLGGLCSFTPSNIPAVTILIEIE